MQTLPRPDPRTVVFPAGKARGRTVAQVAAVGIEGWLYVFWAERCWINPPEVALACRTLLDEAFATLLSGRPA